MKEDRFENYKILGFKFDSIEGLFYCSNLSDMYDLYGYELCYEVVDYCREVSEVV